jgi:adenylosuccinate lyase/3-carboxy-cis,cis-muconate cycloisomerase
MDSIGLLSSVTCKNWFHQPAVAIWTDGATLAAWIEVEVALAEAQAQLGLIPRDAAETIARRLANAQIDGERLTADIAHMMHPFVPVLHQLEELCGEPAAAYLHWGATTQNIFDTGAALQLKRSHAMLLDFVDKALSALAALARKHRDTPQAGRTHGQHALPITFGFKVAAWHAEMRRHRQRLEFAARGAFLASTGGAVGAFAAMAGKGREVQALVARRLGLESNELPVRGAYDHTAAYVTALAMMGSTVEKIAGEVFTQQRTEIAEVAEGFHRGKVGSSTMAQKRNPGLVMNLTGVARLLRSRVPIVLEAMLRHDEGDGASNNVCDVTLPETAICAVSLAHGLLRLVEGLEVDRAAMGRNLERSGGLIVSEAVMMGLAPHIGRHHAHKVLYDIAQDTAEGGGSFAARLREHPLVQPLLGRVDIDALLDPKRYVGEAPACVDDELARGTEPHRPRA